MTSYKSLIFFRSVIYRSLYFQKDIYWVPGPQKRIISTSLKYYIHTTYLRLLHYCNIKLHVHIKYKTMFFSSFFRQTFFYFLLRFFISRVHCMKNIYLSISLSIYIYIMCMQECQVKPKYSMLKFIKINLS